MASSLEATTQNPLKLTKRQLITKEIFDTEASYVKSLLDCQLYYHQVLQKKNQLKQSEVTEVFQDFDQVIAVNQKLLSDLKGEDNLEAVIVNKFKMFVPFMKAYKQFVSNNENAFSILSEWEDDKEISDILEECRTSIPAEIQHDLRSLLIMPVQRIPRYVLLLKELKTY
ncbi:Pleckstrin (PH) domain-containing protein [Entamoeba marina]